MRPTFICNICSTKNAYIEEKMGREIPSCDQCGSTQRVRGMAYLLSKTIYNKIYPLNQFPPSMQTKVIGLSDDINLSDNLPTSLNYQNTFYHCEPKLDITDPGPEYLNSCDVVISSDVFEHVIPPVSRAFSGVFKVLKEGGTFIFQVPYTLEEKTLEHFPNLYNFELIKQEDRYFLENHTIEGKKEVFNDLIFHGGLGSTLEMRVFSKNDILKNLQDAGFVNIEFYQLNDPHFGLSVKENWSLPVLAKRPHKNP